MVHLLYHPAGAASAPRLAAFLGIVASRDLSRATDRADWLIRWGSASRVRYRPSRGTLNRRRSLASYSNRLEELDLLKDGGVSVPLYMPTVPPAGHAIIARDFPDGRQNTGGRGITVYRVDDQASPDHDLYVWRILKERQFRVHAICGATRVRELVADEGTDPSNPIWNADGGYTFRIPDSIPPRIEPLAVAAVKALGLDFGAVDIITRGSEAWVLEVNTAPGLCDATLEWYADRLAHLTHLTDIPGWDAVESLNEGDPDEAQVP